MRSDDRSIVTGYDRVEADTKLVRCLDPSPFATREAEKRGDSLNATKAHCLGHLSICLRVFIKCPKCGKYNCIREVMPQRIGLALFHGSEDPVKCLFCGAAMDALTAFCGLPVQAEDNRSNIILRRRSGQYFYHMTWFNP